MIQSATATPRCRYARTRLRSRNEARAAGVAVLPAVVVQWVALTAVLLVSACSTFPRGGYYQDDGPDARPPIDVMRVPDAVPRAEPPSENGNKPYTVFGVAYTPLTDARGYRERGIASWYGRKFHGRRTASGEPYDMYAMTAAHRTLPLPSYARVRNLENGRSVVVRVNDRGPFLDNRLIDLSYTAAARLGMLGTGTAMVEVESLTPGRAPTTVATTSGVQFIRTADATPLDAELPRLSVQVGAFSRYENATSLRDRLLRAGFSPIYIQKPASGAGGPVYRVRIGPIATVKRGDELVAEVAHFGVPDALLVVD
jgi:peptidoglycan lytic transglycosylase